jgi:hypothetical protein
MLGDGHLYKSSITSNTRLEMSFGNKYKNFSESLEILFSDYMKNPIKLIKIKGKNKIYVNYRLKTKTFPIFNKYFKMFYSYNF